MADSFVQGYFAFTCSIDEAALIEEGWLLSADLMAGFEPCSPSPEFLAIFPQRADADPFSGFRTIFDDADFPDFGADLRVENPADDPSTCMVSIFSATDFQPEPIAALIQRCCKASLSDRPIGFEWSFSCSRPVPDGFGGGWCAIFADRLEIETTREVLSKALEGERVRITCPSSWMDDPDHPADDWKLAISNDDTRLGYIDWIQSQRPLVAVIEARGPDA